MTEENILVNNYIPYYPDNEDNLHEILLRHEYERINKDKKNYFKKVKMINFDIIYHETRGDPLKNSVEYYETIKKKDLKHAKEEDRDDFISEGIRSNRKDIHIEKDIINEHFQMTEKLIDFREKNKSMFSSMHGRKKNKKEILADFKERNKSLFSSMHERKLNNIN